MMMMSMMRVLCCIAKNEDLVGIAKERTRTETSTLISRMIFPMPEAIIMVIMITMEVCEGTEIVTRGCLEYLSKI